MVEMLTENVQTGKVKNEGKPSPMQTIRALEKAMQTRGAVSVQSLAPTELSPELANRLQDNLSVVTKSIRSHNSEIQRLMKGKRGKVYNALITIPGIGQMVKSRYMVKSEALVKQMKDDNSKNKQLMENDLQALLEEGKRVNAYLSVVQCNLELIRDENWTLPEIRNFLAVLSGNTVNSKATEMSELMADNMDPVKVEQRRENLIRQIEAISSQAEISKRIIYTAMQVIDQTLEQNLIGGIGLNMLGQPAAKLQTAAITSLLAAESEMNNGKAVQVMFQDAILALETTADAIKLLQEEGIGSSQSVARLESMAQSLESKL